ncbi:unnamed protein product, partial [marine sediment metagenome]
QSLWSGLLGLWSETTVVHTGPPDAASPPAEEAAVDVSPGPWWFDYPDPWQWQFDGTWLARAELDHTLASLEPADDWMTVVHWALLHPEEE